MIGYFSVASLGWNTTLTHFWLDPGPVDVRTKRFAGQTKTENTKAQLVLLFHSLLLFHPCLLEFSSWKVGETVFGVVFSLTGAFRLVELNVVNADTLFCGIPVSKC